MNLLQRVDAVRLAKGAGTAFTVLVVGGLTQPLVGAAAPVIGSVWLILVAVAAFTVAGLRANSEDTDDAELHGAVSATVGYVIVLPLVVMATRTIDPLQVALTLLVAVVVGAVAGRVAARRA